VLVNRTLVTEHEGGWLPFEAEIGAVLRPGVNEVAVHVTAPTDDPAAYPEYPFSEIPAGKQSWYGPLGGIWQPVLLERRALDHIRLVRLRPQRNGGVVEVRLNLSRPLSVPHDLALQIDGPDGRTVRATSLALAAGQERARASLAITEPLDWSPDAPHLYQLRAVLRRGGEVADLVRERFGFRSIETRAGRIYLNGQPLYLRAIRTTTPTGSAHRRPGPFWRISSAKPKPSGSTACAATSRCPIRCTTRLPTGSAS
jgi:beta-galactosidase/beta-glucuronidase